MSDTQTVQEIYAAFGRGDVPAILARLGDDVAWDVFPAGNAAQDAGVPWLAARRGRDDVAGFFALIAEQLEIRRFAVTSLLAGERAVCATIEIEALVRATGSVYRDDELHLWELGPGGEVVRFRHFTDTAKHMAAAGVGAAV